MNNDEIIHTDLSPLVRNMVRENSLSADDLKIIKGSGLDGRITKNDILSYLSGRDKGHVPETKSSEIISTPVSDKEIIAKTDFLPFGEAQVAEMSAMRKIVAENMQKSVQIAPHVTSFAKADITDFFNWFQKQKEVFEKKEGEMLTLLPLLIRETVRVLKEFPEINVSFDGDSIIYKKYYNIGIATVLSDGSLAVPVIKDADQKNLYGLARAVNDLSLKARNNALQPDETTGGTFTVSDLGSFGTLAGTSVINQPESAVLAFGLVRKEPAVVETPAGDGIAIRLMIILSLTFDLRIIDYALAGKFLKQTAKNIEKFDINSSI